MEPTRLPPTFSQEEMKRVELQIERILKQRKEIWEGEHEIANMEKEIEELNKQSAKIEEEMTSSGPGHYEAAIQSLNSMGEIIVS
jgi:septal ring factor EnvC (AmiA/AmiB activator)